MRKSAIRGLFGSLATKGIPAPAKAVGSSAVGFVRGVPQGLKDFGAAVDGMSDKHRLAASAGGLGAAGVMGGSMYGAHKALSGGGGSAPAPPVAGPPKPVEGAAPLPKTPGFLDQAGSAYEDMIGKIPQDWQSAARVGIPAAGMGLGALALYKMLDSDEDY